jgi:hypothetical protein
MNMSTTAHGTDWPSLIQFSIFLPERVGALQQLLRVFSGEPVRILGISVVNLVDCAVVRMVLSDPELGRKLLHESSHASFETQVLAVEMQGDSRQPILDICSTLLGREVSIDYIYPMFRGAGVEPAFLLHVDDIAAASQALQAQGFRLITEADLS